MAKRVTKALLISGVGLAVSLISPGVSSADTVWKTAKGVEELCARDVLVSFASATWVQYRELKGSVVESGSCNATEPLGEALRVASSTPDEKRAILTRWMKLGHTAEITDITGKQFTVYNTAVHFVLPKGLACMRCPGKETAFVVETTGKASTHQFQDIERVEVSGRSVAVKLRRGAEISGDIVPQMIQNAATSTILVGIEDLGTATPADFSIELRQIRTLKFQ